MTNSLLKEYLPDVKSEYKRDVLIVDEKSNQ